MGLEQLGPFLGQLPQPALLSLAVIPEQLLLRCHLVENGSGRDIKALDHPLDEGVVLLDLLLHER
ncbi:MAG: hypothetical protein ACRD0N_05440 [Acidimicrobiales bacterium]